MCGCIHMRHRRMCEHSCPGPDSAVIISAPAFEGRCSSILYRRPRMSRCAKASNGLSTLNPQLLLPYVFCTSFVVVNHHPNALGLFLGGAVPPGARQNPRPKSGQKVTSSHRRPLPSLGLSTLNTQLSTPPFPGARQKPMTNRDKSRQDATGTGETITFSRRIPFQPLLGRKKVPAKKPS